MIAISRDPCDVTLSARSQVLSIISKRLVRKSLDMFADIQKDEEKYATFLQNFGRYLKVGLIEDKDNKDALLKLTSFASSGSTDRGTTLPEYKERMKEGQKQIYYVSGTSKARPPPPSDCPPISGGSPPPHTTSAFATWHRRYLIVGTRLHGPSQPLHRLGMGALIFSRDTSRVPTCPRGRRRRRHPPCSSGSRSKATR